MLLVQGHDGYIFPTPGRYRLRLRYDDAKRGIHAASKWSEVGVDAPTRSEDVAVLDGLQRGVPPIELMAAYPGSRYWWLNSLFAIRDRLGSILDGQAPETRGRVPRSDLDAWRKAQYRDVVARLESLAAEAPDWWEREALSQAQVIAEKIGDVARAADLKARLDAKYPGWRDVPDLEL